MEDKDAAIKELRYLLRSWQTYFGLDADEDDYVAQKLMTDTRALLEKTK